MHATSLLLAGILALSASAPHESFRYEVLTSFRRNEESCRICYGDDCITMDAARCEYYVETDEIVEKPEDDGDVTEVDGLMYDLTQQASMSWMAQECLPLISEYSDCNKENVCIGCKSCACNGSGKWVCRNEQRCRADAALDVDHRVLVVVSEKLMEYEKNKRKKRSIKTVTNNTEGEQMSFADIAEWMYGVKPNGNADKEVSDAVADNFTINLPNAESSSTQASTTISKSTDAEYLDFEEVLKNIAIDDQTLKRRKSQLKDNSDTTFDYMDLDDVQIIKRNASDQFMSVLNAIEEGKVVTESNDDATLFVDLLTRVNQNDFYDDSYTTDKMDISNLINKEENNTINTSNDEIELDAVNIMKRDVSSVTELNNTTQATSATTTIIETTIDQDNDLKNNVLIPLSNIIEDKQNEINELMQIKENLMRVMNLLNDTVNFTKESDILNGSTTNFSIYKLDLFPEIHENLRRNNPNILEKLLYKLKRDIYEVLRDIARIQKLSKIRGLPDDLKMLIRSMKYYVNKQGSIRNFKKKDIKLEYSQHNARRVSVRRFNTDTTFDIKNQLADILEVLDKGTPQSNALATLSRSTKKIMKRVIKQNYVDEFSIVGFKVFDSEYNLTNDLRTIGKNWAQLTAHVESSSPHEKLYAMMLLHFTLSGDINKLSDAVSLVDFAHSRRMLPIESSKAEDIMIKINDGLLLIRNKVELLLKYHTAHTKNTLRQNSDAPKKKIKKESFLKRIRNMLRGSKKDIIDMAKQKIPKSEIFKTIAKKKLNELSQKQLSDDGDTMLRWQRRFNMQQRQKREILTRITNIKNRMKSIIPKYLRGKINPAIAKKRKPKKHSATRKKKTTTMQKNLATTSIKATLPMNLNNGRKH